MTEEQNKLADRLQAMLDQVGHPDYSLRELYEGLKLIVWELREREPATEAVREPSPEQWQEFYDRVWDSDETNPTLALPTKELQRIGRALFNALKGKGASAAACPLPDPDAPQPEPFTDAQNEQMSLEAAQMMLPEGYKIVKEGKGASQGDGMSESASATITSLYYELLYAVGNKYPGETRHQTALRYIRRAEKPSTVASQAASPDEQKG